MTAATLVDSTKSPADASPVTVVVSSLVESTASVVSLFEASSSWETDKDISEGPNCTAAGGGREGSSNHKPDDDDKAVPSLWRRNAVARDGPFHPTARFLLLLLLGWR